VWVERTLEAVVSAIYAGAAERDACPSFPEDAFSRLALSGVLAIPSPDPVGELGRRSSFAEEWSVLRAVARADGSIGRILDGHFNGVERLSLLAPEPLLSGLRRAALSHSSPKGRRTLFARDPLLLLQQANRDDVVHEGARDEARQAQPVEA
jgi:alkylation response protein AidB-like acyl-CoA dehydrogenase